MSVTITSVTLQGTNAFAVGGTTSAAGQQVAAQAFIGQSSASPESSTTSSADKTWSVTLTLNATFQEGQAYRTVARCQDGDRSEVMVPPFFGLGPPLGP